MGRDKQLHSRRRFLQDAGKFTAPAAAVGAAGLEIIPHRGASSWGFPIAPTSPACTMAESFPAGSAILDAMSCKVENGFVLAPQEPGFGTSLTEQMVLDHRLTSRI